MAITRPSTDKIVNPDTGGVSLEWKAKFTQLFNAVSGPFPLRPYTVATLPNPVQYAYCLVFVTDAFGGACVACSDGVNWKKIALGATVA